MIFPENEPAVPGEMWPRPLRFLGLADYVADKWSKDPSTKCGAVIANDRRRQIGMGYNGFPDRIEDKPEWWNDREIKLSMVIHAEVNAINNTEESVEGAALFCTGPCCSACAKFMVSKGIGEVHFRKPAPGSRQEDFARRWSDDLVKAFLIFERAGVAVQCWDETGPVVWTPFDTST